MLRVKSAATKIQPLFTKQQEYSSNGEYRYPPTINVGAHIPWTAS